MTRAAHQRRHAVRTRLIDLQPANLFVAFDKTPLFLEYFPYVCPEPVLVKR
jgi:hypothetical protein